MGAGAIHAILLGYFYTLLIEKTDKKKYWILSGETGLKIEKKNIYSLDLAVYLKENLAAGSIGTEPVNVAPELIIKINISVEGDHIVEDEHLFMKVQRHLNFGTQKIIWIFLKTKMIMVAQTGAPWQMHQWSSDLTLLDGIEFNMDTFCQETGIYV